MDQTFITIHNLSPDSNILFASDSICEILGYQPREVLNKSCFAYFHPDEVPLARYIHDRGVLLDKAAVLHYARILSRDGRWVSCECCFTVVNDVLVASTSVYKLGEKSERRAIEAPQIQRIFSTPARDPRYRMLEHLSPKFTMPPVEHEPRAALILNRFTRSLSIMFATNSVYSVLGLAADRVHNKSFYECIQERCLHDAVRCIESAKANDSIAYLRFWSRDPRRPEDFEESDDDDGGDDETSDDDPDSIGEPLSEEIGIATSGNNAFDGRNGRDYHLSDSGGIGGGVKLEDEMQVDLGENRPVHSANYTCMGSNSSGSQSTSEMASLWSTRATASPVSEQTSISDGDGAPRLSLDRQCQPAYPLPSCELEAVVSCTSDGLVVVIRRARPQVPDANLSENSEDVGFEDGLFAAPWARQPIQPYFPPGAARDFRPPFMPHLMPLRDDVRAAEGPPVDQLMTSIRDVAVFAWALVGINGTLATHSRGTPRGGSQPHDVFNGWDVQQGKGPQHNNQAALKPRPHDFAAARRDTAMRDAHESTLPTTSECSGGIVSDERARVGRAWQDTVLGTTTTASTQSGQRRSNGRIEDFSHNHSSS